MKQQHKRGQVPFGGNIIIKDITLTLSDETFLQEYIVANAFLSFISRHETQTCAEIVTSVMAMHPFNPRKQLPHKEIMNRMFAFLGDAEDAPGGARLFKRLESQANILEYIATGEWKYGQFTATDKVYSICFTSAAPEEIPLIWFIISRSNHGYLRLHAWSLSMLSFFVKKLHLQQTFQLYKQFGPICLSYVLHVFGDKMTVLFYTPYSDDPHTTTNVIKTLTDDVDKTAIVEQSEDETLIKESLGETQYVHITDSMRKKFSDMELVPGSIQKCITCGTEKGKYFDPKLGKEIVFCSQECFIKY